MKLLLARHGEAQPGDLDSERTLSRKGRSDVRTLAMFLGTSGIEVEQAFHSGIKRCEETAVILADAICRSRTAEPLDGLLPDDATDTLAAHVRAWREDTLVVGHLTHVQRLCARLLTRHEDAHPSILFRPGTIVCLEGEGDLWSVEWVVRPELLGRADLMA